MFKNLLIPYDFSESSHQALKYGLKLVQKFSSKLHIIHAVGVDMRHFPAGIIEWTKDMDSIFHQEIRKDVLKSVDEEVLNNQIEIEIVQDQPDKVILNFIHEHHPDLVLMGTHGRGGFKHAILGSVAEKVIRHSQSPVWVVRNQDDIKKVLLPVDFSEHTEEAVLTAMQFCDAFEAELHLAHVVSFGDMYQFFPNAAPYPFEINEKKLKQQALADLTKLSQKHKSHQLHLHVVMGVVHQEIIALAQRSQCDIVLMPTHGRSGLGHLVLGSSAEMVIRYADRSVLTFLAKDHVPYKKTALGHLLNGKLI
ncbi:hypothetical protein BVY03_03510 [bacterium K02(2017)]|nr:hypothetical protein BVY03_03510 [bacterium K02(2017)]